jgi:hypothetical protein
MKRMALLGSFGLVFVISIGCMNMRTNTRPPSLPDDAVPSLNIQQPIALQNSAPQAGEVVIGTWAGWKVHADLYKYTESTIGAVRNALETQNIEVADGAAKILELAVYEASSKQNMWNFTVKTALRVRTGDGYEQTYEDATSHGNGYGTTSAMEKTLAKCIAKMFDDAEIRTYLER